MKIQFNRLNHIQICIPNGEEAKARQFYCEILGIEEIEKPDALQNNGGFWLAMNGIQIHIGTEKFQGKSKRHAAFEVVDLDKIKKYLSDNQVVIENNKPIPGFNRFSLFDYWDNRIELMEKVN